MGAPSFSPYRDGLWRIFHQSPITFHRPASALTPVLLAPNYRQFLVGPEPRPTGLSFAIPKRLTTLIKLELGVERIS